MTREGAMAKEKKEASPEDVLRDLVSGKIDAVPAEGLPGVAIIYQSGPVRIHPAVTTGPVEITPEGNVLVNARITGYSTSGGSTARYASTTSAREEENDFTSTVAFERVPFGIGPRTWRLTNPHDKLLSPRPKSKNAPRTLGPGEVPRMLGSLYDLYQTHAEIK